MASSSYELSDILKIQDIIERASQASIVEFFQQSKAEYKADGSIVTNADIAMQEFLAQALAQIYPDVAMLSEEISDEDQLAAIESGRDYWCLDPLDGTTNYHATLPLYSVSLALVSAGEVVLAIIYDPNSKEFFAAIKGGGFYMDGVAAQRPIQPAQMSSSIAFIDFKRLNKKLRTSLVNESVYKSQRNIGTCALEWAWLAAGRVQLLIHGSEKLWDYAAGSLLLSEAGGYSQTLEGEQVFVESLTPRSVIAASDGALFQQWINWLASQKPVS